MYLVTTMMSMTTSPDTLPAAPARAYHHGNLRAALLEHAQRMLREGTGAELSLRELSRAVGVSHAAPRRHFPDRQGLLDALAEAGFARLGTELRAAADRAGPGLAERFLAVAGAYVSFATRDAALLELMFAGKQREESQTLHAAADRALSVLLALIQQGQADGLLDAGPPERVGFLLFATIQGIAALLNAGMIGPGQIHDLLGDAIAQFLRGSHAGAEAARPPD
jgi:AcrR family transcriptional regulator